MLTKDNYISFLLGTIFTAIAVYLNNIVNSTRYATESIIPITLCMLFMLIVGWLGGSELGRGEHGQDTSIEPTFGQTTQSVEQEADNWLKAENREITGKFNKIV